MSWLDRYKLILFNVAVKYGFITCVPIDAVEFDLIVIFLILKSNNKITELQTIFQRESQNS
jgi:hypothetical protein